MKVCQLIEYHKRNIFLKNFTENEAGKLVPDLSLFFKKTLYCKSKWSAAWFHYISIALKLAYNRNKLFKILHYRSRDMLNFVFLDKGLGIISPAHFVHDFSTKMFPMLYFINWPNFIVWLPLLREILGGMCTATVCSPGCDVINFKINMIFLIKPFFIYDQKGQDKNLNILRTKNEKSFRVKWKTFFIIFKGLSVVKICLRP